MVISIRKENILAVIYMLIIAFALGGSLRDEAVPTFSMPVSKKVILIDSGHGGWDPGKVGGDEALEKNINLAIAKKLQMYLEQGGSYVLMTRVEDEALGDRKSTDMSGRKEITNTSNADMLISIHQNSYPDDSIHGAQTFYFEDSEKSKQLAEKIQAEIKAYADPTNRREAKSNSDYYILKQTSIPAVIIECGFLSNPLEQENLLNEEYQDKIAWSIYKGIIGYYEKEK